MAKILRKPRLLALVVEAIHACGWDVLILSSRDDHPFALSIFKGDTKVSLLVYIWNLTHGGFPRDPNEFRIQVTGVSQIELREGWETLLLGWSDDLRVFVGFDSTKHQISMTGRPPSIQIKRNALEKAVKNGFALQARDNQEIAVAFRPDFLTSYVLGMSQLHKSSAAVLETKALERISREEAVDFDLDDIEPKERRQVLQTVNRKIRDARFRANVLRAYSYRCCVCGIQLDLLDAAHIIPVEHERGTDEIKNGLSLCALHHRAFDHALITVCPNYSIGCCEKEFSRLRTIGWHSGESEFKSALRDEILLPPKKEIYPLPEYLEFGRKLRGWIN
ncbi:MAG TPA: HNH endonuclease [Candidatus Saccharimonadales bacterium]|nr:HNH endonuclease [Candidatus Saccharimonadales bacterium]